MALLWLTMKEMAGICGLQISSEDCAAVVDEGDCGSMATETMLEMGVVVRLVSGWSGEKKENGDEMQTLGRND